MRCFPVSASDECLFFSCVSRSCKCLIGVAVILLSCWPKTNLLAKGEVTDIYSIQGDATMQTQYVEAGNSYLWGQGNDGQGTGGDRLIEGFSLDNGATRYEYQRVADMVRIVRTSAATPCGLFAETTGNVRSYRPDFPGNPDGSGCDMAVVMAGRVINVGVLDLFNNAGAAGKNVERVDFIFNDGIFVAQPAGSGHVVTEKSGNNNVKIAAILSLDGSGNPASYGPLIEVHAHAGTPNIGCPNPATDICYGVPNDPWSIEYLHTADAGTPPTRVGGAAESMGLAFVSQTDLGLSQGETYYGFSYFAPDVDAAVHTLTDPASFPGNTDAANRGPGDADLHGGTAGLFVLTTLLKNVTGDVVDSASNGISAVTIQLYRDDGDTPGRYDPNDSLLQTTETDAGGSFIFTRVLAGDYIIRVDAADSDLATPGYTTATDALAITVDGTDLTGQRFVFALPVISGSVFIDRNENGVLDSGEEAQGVTLRLFADAAMQLQIGEDVRSGADGAFSMGGVPNGTYYLFVDQGSAPSLADLIGGSDNPLEVTVSGGSDVNVVFPFTIRPPVVWTLNGSVFLDVDGNGQQNGSGEPGVGQITVMLYDTAGNQAGSLDTDEGGGFTFDGVLAGEYTLQLDSADLPRGYALSTDYDLVPVTLQDDVSLLIPLSVDHDGDGVVDDEDLDDDNDGILDTAERKAGSDVDTDGDGIVDRLDRDSDNDGILDAFESGAVRITVQDGYVAGTAGPNGLPDAVESGSETGMVNYGTPRDSDGDGVPDFLDLDSDNDGITDVIEAGGIDEEPDGRLGDALSPQVDEWGLSSGWVNVPADTDGDGIPDYLELDSDADTIKDVVEAGYEDRDRDGVVDDFSDPDGDGAGNPAGFSSFLKLPDKDSDGVPDYREKDTLPRLETGLNGMGCMVGSNRSLDPLFPLLVLVSLFHLFGKQRGNENRGGARRDAASVVLAGLILMTVPAVSISAEEGFAGRWYGSIGVGLSELEPDPNSTVYTNEETRSSGGKLTLGYDWSERFSIEAYYADLGEARIGSTVPVVAGGTIEYKDYGLSGLYYLYKQYNTRRGLGVFARAGVGKMENRTDLPYKRLNDEHLLFGIGFEYGFSNGLALRSELDQYDTDSRLLTLSLLKRFGSKGQREEPRPVAKLDTEPGAAELSTLPAPSASRTVKKEKEKKKVKLGELGTVYFPSDSADLNQAANNILEEIVAELQRVPDVVIDVEGHTDSRGSDAYNLALSERRIEAVISYLTARGIARHRLKAKPYGERHPVASNATPQGRQLNRRVELREHK